MRVSHPTRIARRPLVNRARLNYWADMIAFAAGAAVLSRGLVLLTRFHMGDGALNGSALGASRLAWVNIHRLMATVLVAAVAIHVYLHWHSLTVRVGRAYKGLPGKAARHICIDIHNISGLIVLPTVVIHIRRHFGWLLHASGWVRTTVFNHGLNRAPAPEKGVGHES